MGFTQTTHEEWIAKVRKELKLDDLSAKAQQIDQHLSCDPFFERNPKEIEGFQREKTWKIREVFDAKVNDNSDLLTALQGGVNSLEIINAGKINKPSEFFHDIHLDFIELHLIFESETNDPDQNGLIKYLEKQSAEKKLNVRVVQADVNSKHMWNVSRFTINADEDITDSLTNTFDDIINYIDEAGNKDHAIHLASKIEIEKVIGPKIIQEIAIRKAIERLWEQVCLGFDINMKTPLLYANCIADKNLELESKYIEQSVKGLSAAISAYDSIYIAPADTSKAEFHNRISRNIHHLLQMESFVQKGYKAYVGSYQIEHLATEIAKKVWKNIGRA